MLGSKDAKKEIILEVAKKHFESYGYKRTVIDDIVREVGIAKGTFYLYFPSKEKLFVQVLDGLRARLMGELLPIMEGTESPREKLRAMLTFTFEALNDPFLSSLYKDGSEFQLILNLVDQPDWKQEIDNSITMIKGLIMDGIEKGEFREDLDVDAIPFLIGSLKFLHYYKDVVTRDLLESDRLVASIIDVFISGLSKKD